MANDNISIDEIHDEFDNDFRSISVSDTDTELDKKFHKMMRKRSFGGDKNAVSILRNNMFEHDGIAIGVDDVDDWIQAKILKQRYLSGVNTLMSRQKFIYNKEKNEIRKWITDHFKQYTFVTHDNVIIEVEDSYIRVGISDKTLFVGYAGDSEFVARYREFFSRHFELPKNSIEWVYNEDGRSATVPLNYRPVLQSAYPWIQQPIKEYIHDYLNSDACVLILIGPPGTGKTTLIKNIIKECGTDAKVAYNTRVLDSDGFFVHFIASDDKVLVLEDADAFLSSRQEGNTMMHRFLNVSDGLVSASDKKLIFSTNLPNISDIDSALTRPGRCYDVLQFRNLTRSEAQAVLRESGKNHELPSGNEFSLAEVFNTHEHTTSVNRKRIGF